MQAALHGSSGDEPLARQTLRQLLARWNDTPPGSLARAWLKNSPGKGAPAIPFPSAIRPLVLLRAAEEWADRAIPVAS
jgi:hypothetical protein